MVKYLKHRFMPGFLLFSLVLIIGCTSNSNQKKLPVPETVSQSVIDICKVEGKSTCHEDCLDGFGAYCYFDSTVYKKENLRSGFSFPKETINSCFAIHSGSVCGKCYNTFELRKNGTLKEVSCEEFFQEIENKNKECGDCLESLPSGF